MPEVKNRFMMSVHRGNPCRMPPCFAGAQNHSGTLSRGGVTTFLKNLPTQGKKNFMFSWLPKFGGSYDKKRMKYLWRISGGRGRKKASFLIVERL